MGQEPARIRHQIEETRGDMSETIDALGYKADVPARAKDKVQGAASGVKDSVGGAVGSVKDKIAGAAGSVGDAAPSGDEVGAKAKHAVGVAQENPLGLAVGALAAGFLIGTLLPSTRAEDERMGEMSDQVKHQAVETGEEALEHGKQIAQSAASSAVDTAKQAGQEHADELRSSVQDRVEETREQVAPTPDKAPARN